MFNLSNDKNAGKRFWQWFLKNEDKIFNFETNQEKIFDELIKELHKVNKNLTFEIGPVENKKREFVISADGIKLAFSSVFSLKEVQPKNITKFKVTYFRPRRDILNSITINDLTLSPDDIFIDLNVYDEQIEITLFIENYTDDQRDFYLGHVFILLDEALGEYDVETKVGFIDLQPLTKSNAVISFNDLAKHFDEKYLEITTIN